MTYDAAGNMLSKPRPAPLYYTQSWTYNSMNEVLTATDGRGNTTNYAYNATGLLTSVKDPDGDITSYTYYPDGQIDTVTDPDTMTTTYTYDGPTTWPPSPTRPGTSPPTVTTATGGSPRSRTRSSRPPPTATTSPTT